MQAAARCHAGNAPPPSAPAEINLSFVRGEARRSCNLRFFALAEAWFIRAASSSLCAIRRLQTPVCQTEGDVNQLLGHAARTGNGVSNRDGADLVTLERHHAAKAACMDQVNSADPVARGQHAVKGRRRAAPLRVPQ